MQLGDIDFIEDSFMSESWDFDKVLKENIASKNNDECAKQLLKKESMSNRNDHNVNFFRWSLQFVCF